MLLSDNFHQKSNDKRNQKEKNRNLRCMNQCRMKNSAFFTPTMVLFTKIVYGLFMLLPCVMVVLVAIAGISLLVGGIGIMNIMLVSVSERTREIGIRKSLGAKRKDIRGQFIIEAGTTSAIGGIIGIVLGILLAKGAGVLIDGTMSSGSNAEFTAVISLTAIAVAFGVSVGVGILFGYLPANKAAKLNPIDALRYE